MKPADTPIEALQQCTVQSVVHDLRAPMTVIKGNIQILLSGLVGQMSPDQIMLLERSVGPLEEMILMTENLLQASALDNDDFPLLPMETDLDRVLAELVEFYQLPFHQRGMQFFREGNTLGVCLKVDGTWIKRVLSNLIWNAYKFTPDAGVIKLHVRHAPGGLEVTVEDNGRGIPADRLETIFEKGRQVQSRGDRARGAGLGLWICRRIMELHGGSIRAESVIGQGSRFILFFPSSIIL